MIIVKLNNDFKVGLIAKNNFSPIFIGPIGSFLGTNLAVFSQSLFDLSKDLHFPIFVSRKFGIELVNRFGQTNSSSTIPVGKGRVEERKSQGKEILILTFCDIRQEKLKEEKRKRNFSYHICDFDSFVLKDKAKMVVDC
ncbi:hypothetical protein BpHYR1_022708 [Brachionus plicatilis]|uniref:Uncharacterized protein n=1 Tax=Brachionus plicatilis TaxID=10195 RepID=A0A3M7T6T3_BRAPC|nr:hypothetical protein BpHYR1_022708 [Brachionus plicatilis]